MPHSEISEIDSDELQKINAGDQSIFINEKQLAHRTSMSVKWLQKCRNNGTGIPFHKFGYAVRYRLDDIQNYEAQQRRSPSDSSFLSG